MALTIFGALGVCLAVLRFPIRERTNNTRALLPRCGRQFRRDAFAFYGVESTITRQQKRPLVVPALAAVRVFLFRSRPGLRALHSNERPLPSLAVVRSPDGKHQIKSILLLSLR